MNVWKTICDSLQDVLIGRSRYTELQKIVDDAVIGDALPSDMPQLMLSFNYDLQTELELIAEHESSNLGLSTAYSDVDVISLLSRFGEVLTEDQPEGTKRDGDN